MIKNNPLHKVIKLPKLALTPDPIPSLLQLQKMQNLRIQGYTEDEAEELCRPEEVDQEQIVQELMKWQERELRRLAKLSPKRKKLSRHRMEDVDGVPVVHISPVDLAETKHLISAPELKDSVDQT